jgi:hypothetical protein
VIFNRIMNIGRPMGIGRTPLFNQRLSYSSVLTKGCNVPGRRRSQSFAAAFSPIEDDISIPEDHTPTPEKKTADIFPLSDDLPAFSAEDSHMARRKRSQNFSGAAYAPSPRQIPATANLDEDYLPHVASNNVYNAREPEDA